MRKWKKYFCRGSGSSPWCSATPSDLHAAAGAVYPHVRIPEDLSLIAWSNKYFLSYMTPSISIISIPVEEIGRRAAGIILRNLNGEPHVEKTFIDETLILRESFQPSAGSPPAGVSGQ